MGTATRKAVARNATRQALIQSTFAKAGDAASEYERSQIAAAAREARVVLKTRANNWAKREQPPGNFHRPSGRMVMPAWNDA